MKKQTYLSFLFLPSTHLHEIGLGRHRIPPGRVEQHTGPNHSAEAAKIRVQPA